MGARDLRDVHVPSGHHRLGPVPGGRRDSESWTATVIAPWIATLPPLRLVTFSVLAVAQVHYRDAMALRRPSCWWSVRSCANSRSLSPAARFFARQVQRRLPGEVDAPDMARCRAAAGRDRAFRTEVMNALGLDPGSVGSSFHSADRGSPDARAEPPDVVIVHPEMERDIRRLWRSSAGSIRTRRS